MAYPTVDFKHVSGVMGAQPINESSTTQKHPLGFTVTAVDTTYGTGRFVYCVGVASTAAGDLCCYDSKNGDTARAVHSGATSFGPCGVAMSANGAAAYGWYQTEGAGPVATATVLTDAPLYLTSTAGTLDDLAVSGDLVNGMVSRAASSGGFTTVQMDAPSLSVLGGASGTNSGDVTLAAVGSTPSANGASLSGQVLTLQPADGSQPGLLTTAAQTIAGAKTFSSTPILSSGTLTLSATTTNLITSATSAATASATVGAFTLKPTVTLDANDLVLDVQSAAAAHLLTVDLEGDVVAGGAIVATGAITGTNGTLSGGTLALTATATNLITSATAAATASATVGAFTLKPTVALDANDLVLDVQSSAASHLLTVDQEGDVVALGALGCTNILKVVLTAEAETSNSIEVEGQISDLAGLNAATAREVVVRSLAVSDTQGAITIGAGANPGTLIKAFSPIIGVKEAWITTTAAGHFRFIVTNTAAETNIVQVSANSALPVLLKLTFA